MPHVSLVTGGRTTFRGSEVSRKASTSGDLSRPSIKPDSSKSACTTDFPRPTTLPRKQSHAVGATWNLGQTSGPEWHISVRRRSAIFTAEMCGAFKPDPRVYRRALAYLGVRPEEAAMVASHPYDLEAADSLGLGTIFVSRPLEYGDPALAHEMAAERVTQYVRAIGEIE